MLSNRQFVREVRRIFFLLRRSHTIHLSCRQINSPARLPPTALNLYRWKQ